jgi:hypothetical protein
MDLSVDLQYTWIAITGLREMHIYPKEVMDLRLSLKQSLATILSNLTPSLWSPTLVSILKN